MGDAEFGLRTFTRGIISVSNPEAHIGYILKYQKVALGRLGLGTLLDPQAF